MDFQYQAAHAWYLNLDKLIKHTNMNTNKHGVRLIYSTPSCYLKALHDEDIMWPQKSDDFFPYASDPHAYWTGYFTSRPSSKRMIRDASALLHVAKQLATRNDTFKSALEPLAHAVSVTQHHDAVTGTEKQYVAEDYHFRLAEGMAHFSQAIADNYGVFCPLLNTSQCDFTENASKSFYVSVYNPLSRLRNSTIKVPMIDDHWSVADSQGVELDSQFIPIPHAVLELPGRKSKAKYDLLFRAENLRPMVSTVFYVAKKPRKVGSSASVERESSRKLQHVTSPSRKTYSFEESWQLKQLGNGDKTYQIDSKYLFYIGHRGDNEKFSSRASGAYIFRPKEQVPQEIGQPINSKAYDGKVFFEVQQEFGHSVSQVIRIPQYNEERFDFEVEWMVGPISLSDNEGKEYIHRVTVEGLDSEGMFYTDSNGRQIIQRKRDHRESYLAPLAFIQEPVSANYYPVTSSIFIQDASARFTMVTDRAQGGSSLQDGSVELMLHRRLLDDDAFGVGEPLNETAFGKGLVVRGKHHFLLDTSIAKSNERRRFLTNEINHPPLVTFMTVDQAAAAQSHQMAAPQQLPDNVNLLTLEPLEEQGVYLIRLEHFFEADESAKWSKPVTLDLTAFIQSLHLGSSIKWIRETALGGNVWAEDVDRLKFRVESNDIRAWLNKKESTTASDLTVFETIDLMPMQIRTFKFQIE